MIIGFSGWKGSGKDQCAKYLIQHHKAIRVALADPLKDNVAEEYGIDRSSLDDPARKESPLLNLPVEPKDAFSRMIAEFIVKELRCEKGDQPKSFTYSSGKFGGSFVDQNGDFIESRPLFYTPRALAILKGSVNRSVRSDYWTNKGFEIMEAELNENPNQLIVVTDVRYRSELVQFKERFGEKFVFIRVNRFETSPSTDPSERDLDGSTPDFKIDNTGGIPYLQGQLEGILEKL